MITLKLRCRHEISWHHAVVKAQSVKIAVFIGLFSDLFTLLLCIYYSSY